MYYRLVKMPELVGVLSRYRNRDNLARLERVLAGAGRDESSDRTVRSVRRQKRLNPDQVSELVEARVSGVEIDDLAERYGIDRNTVMAHLQRAGVPGRRWPGRTLDPEQLEAAGRLYESGVNLIAVGQQFDVDRRYLRRTLPEAGFGLRPPGRRKGQS